ncbi:MAG TPA: putative metal-binding motif-containing protein [Myxococcota bacterium]|nr:putative metal-binding motif-containing protein [Myxococcota bacterium]
MLLAALIAIACNKTPGEDSATSVSDEDNDGFASDLDCNDDDPAIHPEASEVCDGVDNDCDDLVDDADDFDTTSGVSFYADGDGDGFGAGVLLWACARPSESSETDDGFGDPEDSREACEAYSGWVAPGTDCTGSSDVSLDNVVVDSCTGSYGGAIGLYECSVTFENVTVSNSTGSYGGAIWTDDASAEFYDSFIETNRAVYGGVFYAYSYYSGGGSEIYFEDTEMDGNTATTGMPGGRISKNSSVEWWATHRARAWASPAAPTPATA